MEARKRLLGNFFQPWMDASLWFVVRGVYEFHGFKSLVLS
jgi:hypothetical protein